MKTVLNKYQDNHRYFFKEIRADKAGWIMELKDKILGVEIDFSVNKNSEISNSHLILQYAKLDSRLIKLVFFLKQANMKYSQPPLLFHRINNFSLSLMVIAFFQKEGLLPNLQAYSELYPSHEVHQIQVLPKE
jgi:DNA polymerase sigma